MIYTTVVLRAADQRLGRLRLPSTSRLDQETAEEFARQVLQPHGITVVPKSEVSQRGARIGPAKAILTLGSVEAARAAARAGLAEMVQDGENPRPMWTSEECQSMQAVFHGLTGVADQLA